jgi:AcrR family transcriptional regulator
MREKSTAGKGDTEQRILAAAGTLLARFGYHGVSTRVVALAAGVNEVTIYRHYPTKRDLYLAVLNSELQQICLRGDLLAHIVEAPDVRAALARTYDMILNTLTQREDLVRLLQYSALELGADLSPLMRRHLGELFEITAHYLQPWIERGELYPVNPKALVLNLVALVIGCNSFERLFSGESTDWRSMFELYSNFSTVSTTLRLRASREG